MTDTIPQQPTLRTVLGDIPLDRMGATSSHDHVLIDGAIWTLPTPEGSPPGVDSTDPRIEDLWWHRQYPNSTNANYVLDDVDLAIAELASFAEAGGSTIIELTPTRAMGRDPLLLRAVAEGTGLNIVAGCGHYVQASHPASVSTASEEDLASQFIAEITEGIEGTAVRAGVIGEIGASHPITVDEAKVLRASVLTQRATGAAISIHTACDALDAHSALDIAEVLSAAGGDLSRVVMGHLDTFAHDEAYLLDVLATGSYLAFDLLGNETFHSEYGFVIPGDSEKIRAIVRLVEAGFGDRILLGHDTAMKIQLCRYGGYGYAHMLRHIVPRLRLSGLDEAAITRLTTGNPAAAFALMPPGANDRPS